jgi:hypothetical protein
MMSVYTGGELTYVYSYIGVRTPPTVIGAGESLYNKWSSAEKLEIDCSNKKVLIIR